ncbi:hypothetical protein AMETH_1045 [Amycolatopsis methanolica 239]|uniref:Uncharacterized protein n=1 Tax=Amycolatopsis methanolica 239 TaxID=1068978 RepID=A0A076MTN7_AMYME|nr:hypothetical protein AMETH_1045 [Amycolatopsis methanolica 239]
MVRAEGLVLDRELILPATSIALVMGGGTSLASLARTCH